MNESLTAPLVGEFVEFPKIARLSREVIISEKIDGTNGQIYIGEDGEFFVGSRTRWITPSEDNYGFAKWCFENRDELLKLGPGRHFGEWWGGGIQRGYGLPKGEKRFSLFNSSRWRKQGDGKPMLDKQQFCPDCCYVVPELYRGIFSSEECDYAVAALRISGSVAAPGFMKPEGIICYHTAAGISFKKTIEKDESPKSISP